MNNKNQCIVRLSVPIWKLTIFLLFISFTFICFLSASCNNNAGDFPVIPENPIGPSSPQPMSEKTAKQYFYDEKIFVGWNLGNTLDALNTWSYRSPKSEETAWGNPKANQALFSGIKAQGFNIVRIPITWTGQIGEAPHYQINEAWLLRVAEVVGYAHNAGLRVIINMHHDDGFDHGWLLIGKAAANAQEKVRITEKYFKVWMQIAGFFKNYGDYLIFESMNEVQDGGWGWSGSFRANPKIQIDILNEWNQMFTNAVRSSGGNNEKRYLMYPSYASNPEALLPDGRYAWGPAANQGWDVGKYFKLPDDSASGRQIVTFHYYDPQPFHDGVEPNWGTLDEKSAVDNLFARIKKTYTDNNVPVIIGEIGPTRVSGKLEDGSVMTAAQIAAARTSRISWIEYVFSKAKSIGMIPVYWDNGSFNGSEYSKGQLGIFNRANGQPNSEESAEVIRAMMRAVGN